MSRPVYFRRFKSPFGSFELSATPKGLYSLEFVRAGGQSKNTRKMPKKIDSMLRRAAAEIRSYLRGKRRRFKRFSIDWTGFGRFERRVLTELKRIPFGKTESYQFLARKAGHPKAVRYVGRVLNLNRLPLIFPCHRIILKSGGPGGFSKGLKWKKRLLKLESGCADINLERI